MFENLFDQATLPDRPMPTILMPKQHVYPGIADCMLFVRQFAQQQNPKAWLENMGVGENYSTSVCDADFLAIYAVGFLSDPVVRRSETGEKFFELMGDLCDLARRAGKF